MMPQTISATDLRTRTREILQRAHFQDQVFIVENFGQPMAVILGVAEYEDLIGQSETKSTPAPVPKPNKIHSRPA